VWLEGFYSSGWGTSPADLVKATSAEVLVNGQAVGVLVAPPWRLPIGHLLQAGRNRIEVLVCNTLANHYQTIPTRYLL
jgi:hypothetical protein